jgi:hypothetical protein
MRSAHGMKRADLECMRIINDAFPAGCVNQCFFFTKSMLFSRHIILCTDAKLALGVCVSEKVNFYATVYGL